MDKTALQCKANAIAKSIVPRPSLYSHEDEHTYLYNQLVWAIKYCYQILLELNKDKDKATEKWNTELDKTTTDVTACKIIKACLADNFTTTPQKCVLTQEDEAEYRHLVHLDEMDRYR